MLSGVTTGGPSYREGVSSHPLVPAPLPNYNGSKILASTACTAYTGPSMSIKAPAKPRRTDTRPHLLFTYGTMMKGNRNHTRIVGAVPIGPAVTVRPFALYCMGYAPGMVHRKEGGVAVQGEVYLLDRAMLDRVDSAEGHPWKYFRERLEVEVQGFGRAHAWGYLIQKRFVETAKPVPEGRWTQPAGAALPRTTSAWSGGDDWETWASGLESRRLKRARRRGRYGHRSRFLPIERDLDFDGDWEMLGDHVVYRALGSYWDVETGKNLGPIESRKSEVRLVQDLAAEGLIEAGTDDVRSVASCPECEGAMHAVSGTPLRWCGSCDYSESAYGSPGPRILSTPPPAPDVTHRLLREAADERSLRGEACRKFGHTPDRERPGFCFSCEAPLPKVKRKPK